VKRILYITGGQNTEEEHLQLLGNQWDLKVVANEKAGYKLLKSGYFDALIARADHPLNPVIQRFIDSFQKNRPVLAPIIFISENASHQLRLEIIEKHGFAELISDPIDLDDFKVALARIEAPVSIARSRIIQIIDVEGDPQTYNIEDIYSVQKFDRRYIKIYGACNTAKVFPFDFPITEFITEYKLEIHLKQAHQSWLVNVANVKRTDPTKMWLVMKNGTVVSTTRNHVDNFRDKEKRTRRKRSVKS